MAANYHTHKPHILDFSQYPGETPSDVEIEEYALGSHLFWGLWGIISEHVNDIDFDYKEYARQRFQQYWLMKPVLQRS
ncbi:choline/ethanolamine kinase [Carex littledalei]|uniref:Choline/ethanolamine kinase n=1 Tax=Carex littledalei TaxID=544730 RepID=A0A833QPN2_9POAL|nr:choline/ethanolamine kinase [Carex littledalei]